MTLEEIFLMRWRRRRWLGKFWFVALNALFFGGFFALAFSFLFFFVAVAVVRYVLELDLDVAFIRGVSFRLVSFVLAGSFWAYIMKGVWERNEAAFRQLETKRVDY